VLDQARKERINQLSGSNQYSTNQLLQAYISNNPLDSLIAKDQANLQNLASRIAVYNHFKDQKQSGKTSLST